MSDRDRIQAIVDQVVEQALNSSEALLRSEIARRIMDEIGTQPAEPVSALPAASYLARGIKEIHVGTSQKEILRALLDSSSNFATRIALFVVKNGQAIGWQARGFQSNDALKEFALDSSAPAVSQALAGRVATKVAASEFDARFFEKFGSSTYEGWLSPLILKDRVAALVYADGAAEGTQLDADSLSVLVQATGAWLEVNALRKQAHKEQSPGASDGRSVTTAASPEPAFNDPFGAHPPAYAMSAAASAHSTSVVEVPQAPVKVSNPRLPPTTTARRPKPSPHPEILPPSSGISQDEEVHLKARRFARLLVEEIKLYNRDKVSEGRRNNDLYERLKDAIEKSRATYQKRYGNTVAASANYFEDEVQRTLAEDEQGRFRLK